MPLFAQNTLPKTFTYALFIFLLVTNPIPLKAIHFHIKLLLLFTSLFFFKTSFGQGNVVINEYLPWPSNGCGVTAEFVELMNFGPGPVNIGCYVLTDGDFSVTIPPNTILQPGQFYVIAGQSIIPAPCANISSTITADLNWNTCGCTSGAIPTTGDGFFTDGGSGNEQLVLFDANMNIVDAVVRDLPAETSSAITTSNIGGCISHSFDLDTMTINYETLGMSTGRGNSFARILDGDCGWVKDPQQSGGATNNTPTDVSDVTYDFSYVEATDCSENHGSVHISVRHQNLTDFFPIKWTLAFDANLNGIFDFNDQYSYGSDNTPPDMFISGLPAGKYRLTVESVKGCSLKSFDFEILPCNPPLAVQLLYFKYTGVVSNQHKLDWLLSGVENLDKVVFEKSAGNNLFIQSKTFTLPSGESGTKYFTASEDVNSTFKFFRLKIINKNGTHYYSPVITTNISSSYSLHKAWPNPAKNELFLKLFSSFTQKIAYRVYNTSGAEVLYGHFDLKEGINSFSISLLPLSPGIYQLSATGSQPISMRFVKH